MDPLYAGLLGLWFNCFGDLKGSELYLTHFTKEERREAYVVLNKPGCSPDSRHFQAAVVITWRYQVHKGEIQQTFLKEEIAFFDQHLARKFGVDVVCDQRSWLEADAKCLRDISEFKEFSKVRTIDQQKQQNIDEIDSFARIEKNFESISIKKVIVDSLTAKD